MTAPALTRLGLRVAASCVLLLAPAALAGDGWEATFTPATVGGLLPDGAADRPLDVVVVPVGSVARGAVGALVVALRARPGVVRARVCDLMDPMMIGVPDTRLALRCSGKSGDLVVILRATGADPAASEPAAKPAPPVLQARILLPSGTLLASRTAVRGSAMLDGTTHAAISEYHQRRVWYWDGESPPPPGLRRPLSDGFVLGDRGSLLEGRALYAVVGDLDDLEAMDDRATLKTGLWIGGLSGVFLGSVGVLAGAAPVFADDLSDTGQMSLIGTGVGLLGLGLAAFVVGILLPDDPFDLDEQRARVRAYNQDLRDRLRPSGGGVTLLSF